MVDEIKISSDRYISRSATGIELRDATDQSGCLLRYTSAFPIMPKHLTSKVYVDAGLKQVIANIVAIGASVTNMATNPGPEVGDDLDGRALCHADYVLLKDQTDPLENGVYLISATESAERIDSALLPEGAIVFVEGGATNQNKFFEVVGTFTGPGNTPVYGVDEINFNEIDIAALPYPTGVIPGGITNQVLAKASNDDGDVTWLTIPGLTPIGLDDLVDVDASSPTAGDLLSYDGTNWVNGPSLDSFLTGSNNTILYYDGTGQLTSTTDLQVNSEGYLNMFKSITPNGTNYQSLGVIEQQIRPDNSGSTQFRNLQSFSQRIDPDVSGNTWIGGSRMLGLYSSHDSASEMGNLEGMQIGMDLGNNLGGTAGYITTLGSYTNVREGYTLTGYNVLLTSMSLDDGAHADYVGFVDFNLNTDATATVDLYSPFRAGGNIDGFVDTFIATEIGPNFDGGIREYTGFRSNPTFTGAFSGTNSSYVGMNLQPQGDGTAVSVTGIRVNLSSMTVANGRAAAIEAEGGTYNLLRNTKTVSDLFVDSVNNNVDYFVIDAPVSNTEVLLKNNTVLLQFNEDYTSGPLGLGIVNVLSGGQILGDGTASIDRVSFYGAGASIPPESTGGVIENLNCYRSFGLFTLGGALDVTNLVHFMVEEDNIMSLGTNRWGIQINDSAADNFFKKNVVVGGTTKVTSSASTAIEIADKRALKFTPMTEAERDALTAEEGMVVYVRDGGTGALFIYDGAEWKELMVVI